GVEHGLGVAGELVPPRVARDRVLVAARVVVVDGRVHHEVEVQLAVGDDPAAPHEPEALGALEDGLLRERVGQREIERALRLAQAGVGRENVGGRQRHGSAQSDARSSSIASNGSARTTASSRQTPTTRYVPPSRRWSSSVRSAGSTSQTWLTCSASSRGSLSARSVAAVRGESPSRPSPGGSRKGALERGSRGMRGKRETGSSKAGSGPRRRRRS